MAELNPDKWAQSHMRSLALSRWDNEGGASPSRPTEGSAVPTPRHGARPTPGPVVFLLALEASVSSRPVGSGQLDAPVQLLQRGVRRPAVRRRRHRAP